MNPKNPADQSDPDGPNPADPIPQTGMNKADPKNPDKSPTRIAEKQAEEATRGPNETNPKNPADQSYPGGPNPADPIPQSGMNKGEQEDGPDNVREAIEQKRRHPDPYDPDGAPAPVKHK